VHPTFSTPRQSLHGASSISDPTNKQLSFEILLHSTPSKGKTWPVSFRNSYKCGLRIHSFVYYLKLYAARAGSCLRGITFFGVHDIVIPSLTAGYNTQRTCQLVGLLFSHSNIYTLKLLSAHAAYLCKDGLDRA